MQGEETNGDRRDLESVRRGVLREVNDRIAALTLHFADGGPARSAQFICECGDPLCTEPVTVTLDLYESIRAEPRRYLIAVNHEDPEAETVVVVGADHAIVETLAGGASKMAEATDPRRSARFADLVGEHNRRLHSADAEDAR
jgi:hypothetical protein